VDVSSRTEKRVDLSIIIVSWNTRDLLHECLQSLYADADAGALSVEVIVVDNDSQDGSPSMVAERFPGVRLLVNDSNLGFVKANNQALRLACGRHVLLLNPDTEILSGALSTMVAFFQDRPECGLLGCQLLNADRSVQPSFGRFPSLYSEFIYQAYLFRWIPSGLPVGTRLNFWQKQGGHYARTHEVDWVTGACLMIRQDLLARVGLLDERIFMYAEDVDWCYRVKRAGCAVFYLHEAQVVHHVKASSRQDYAGWIANFTRGTLYFFEKYDSRAAQVALSGLVILGSILRLGLWSVVLFLVPARRIEARQRLAGYRRAVALAAGSLTRRGLSVSSAGGL
jgi:GT2 family glycosyltransferase